MVIHNDFLWGECEVNNLYLLKEDDYTFAAKTISCSQDIARVMEVSLLECPIDLLMRLLPIIHIDIKNYIGSVVV